MKFSSPIHLYSYHCSQYQRSIGFCLLLIISLLTSFILNQKAFAIPSLSAGQQLSFTEICENTGEALTETSFQKKLLVFEQSGSVSALTDELPEAIRASGFQDTGLLACLETVPVELETCTFGVLFSVPRIRQDYVVTLIAVRAPSVVINSFNLPGETPPDCENAGIVDESTLSISGARPDANSLTAALSAEGVTTVDSDNDGFNNITEYIQGSDPLLANSPGALLAIRANGSSALNLGTGEALTATISFAPGQYTGQTIDYYVWAETEFGNFSYLYPGSFKASTTPLRSARAQALQLDNFTLFTLPALGVGDYTLHFEARTNNTVLLSSRATVSVTTSNWQFTESALSSGIDYTHGFSVIANGISFDRQLMTGGVAAGDYDNDGWVDIYVTRGSIGENLLFRNLGNGNFSEVGSAAGVNLSGKQNSGATFADYDGDGWLDLMVTGLNNDGITDTQPTLFKNNADGTFSDTTSAAGLPLITQTMSSSFADYDKDGDLDMWLTHWTASNQEKYLWRNNGNGTFTDVSIAAGIENAVVADFSTNFSDINNDGWLDLLIAADFGTSQTYLNQQNGTFMLTTTAVISDENGMGAAVGDYDNDGDLDWFVSSIFDDRENLDLFPNTNWGASGNRLYQNQGNGIFIDATDIAGVREGGWGWGSCFADFNNDSYLDIFHVNGFSSVDQISTAPFENDRANLFISNKDGTFSERSAELNINEDGQGRGIVCFDFDRDGDIDIFVANNGQPPSLYLNEGLTENYLQIEVTGEDLNSQAIGARIYVTANNMTQMRELSAGSNFMSNNPVLAHFGLGSDDSVEEIRVVWPSGDVKILENISSNQLLIIDK